MTKFLIISPTANPTYAERMLATARHFGLEPVLYGLQSNHPHGKDYQGTDIVRILSETDADVVMGVDAPDVAFVAGQEEILQKFRSFKYPFVVSAESDGVGGLRRTQHRMLELADGPMPHMNIGCWAGKRQYALDCFNAAEQLYAHRPEDPGYNYDNHFQWLLMMHVWGGTTDPDFGGLAGPPFHIDHGCVLFQSMNKATTEWLEHTRRIWNTATNTLPPVLHYNGDPTRQAYGEMVRRILK